jgi:hypothetical protein
LDEAKNIGLHFVEVGMKNYISSFRGFTAGAIEAAGGPAAGAPAVGAAANQN